MFHWIFSGFRRCEPVNQPAQRENNASNDASVNDNNAQAPPTSVNGPNDQANPISSILKVAETGSPAKRRVRFAENLNHFQEPPTTEDNGAEFEDEFGDPENTTEVEEPSDDTDSANQDGEDQRSNMDTSEDLLCTFGEIPEDDRLELAVLIADPEGAAGESGSTTLDLSLEPLYLLSMSQEEATESAVLLPISMEDSPGDLHQETTRPIASRGLFQSPEDDDFLFCRTVFGSRITMDNILKGEDRRICESSSHDDLRRKALQEHNYTQLEGARSPEKIGENQEEITAQSTRFADDAPEIHVEMQAVTAENPKEDPQKMKDIVGDAHLWRRMIQIADTSPSASELTAVSDRRRQNITASTPDFPELPATRPHSALDTIFHTLLENDWSFTVENGTVKFVVPMTAANVSREQSDIHRRPILATSSEAESKSFVGSSQRSISLELLKKTASEENLEEENVSDDEVQFVAFVEKPPNPAIEASSGPFEENPAPPPPEIPEPSVSGTEAPDCWPHVYQRCYAHPTNSTRRKLLQQANREPVDVEQDPTPESSSSSSNDTVVLIENINYAIQNGLNSKPQTAQQLRKTRRQRCEKTCQDCDEPKRAKRPRRAAAAKKRRGGVRKATTKRPPSAAAVKPQSKNSNSDEELPLA